MSSTPMPGTVVTRWSKGGRVYLSVRVDEGSQAGSVEYTGSADQYDAGGKPRSDADIDNDCLADIARQRDVQRGGPAPFFSTGAP